MASADHTRLMISGIITEKRRSINDRGFKVFNPRLKVSILSV